MTQAGYVILLGRPNVGKSTLLNRLLAQKISITSPKPQTTRHVILGIKTLAKAQIVYTDTPGIHQHSKKALNRYMNRAAADSLSFADVVVWLVEALRWNKADEWVLQQLNEFDKPILVAVNKVDQVAEKSRLLPFLAQLDRNLADKTREIIPVSALKADNLTALEQCIVQHLPTAEFYFSEDDITTASQRFLVAEIMREKLFRRLNQELPYALTVEVEQFKEEVNRLHIALIIWVERDSQKAIVIGNKGQNLKQAGQQAREDMQKLLQRRVHLQTWVKVRQGWSDNEQALQQLGYTSD